MKAAPNKTPSRLALSSGPTCALVMSTISRPLESEAPWTELHGLLIYELEHRFKYSFRFRLFRFALPLLTPVDRMRIVVSNV